LDAERGAEKRKRETYFIYGDRLSDDGNEVMRQKRKSYQKTAAQMLWFFDTMRALQ